MEWSKSFSENYVRVYGERFSKAVTEKQAAFIAAFIKPYGSIVDIPCGYGRHAEVLAAMGFKVHGVDLYNIPEAQKRLQNISNEVQRNISYEVGDMRTWIGDAALSLFSSFGYFTHDENKKVIGNAAKSLKTGGIIIMDNLNPTTAFGENAEEKFSKRVTLGGQYEESADFDPETHTATVYYVVDGKSISASWKVYSVSELEEMFKENGCIIKSAYGSYNGEVFSVPNSKRLILVVEKVR